MIAVRFSAIVSNIIIIYIANKTKNGLTAKDKPFRLNFDYSASVDNLLSSSDDDCEIGSFERSAADKAAVYVGFRKKLCGVLCVHGSAVLDRDIVGNNSTIEVFDDVADDKAYFVSLVCSSGLAGADSPDGFISDDDVFHLLCGDAHKVDLGLFGNYFCGNSLLSFVKKLAYAEDDFKTCSKSCFNAVVDGDIGLAEILSSFGVSDDNVFGTDLFEHISGDFAGESAGFSPVNVFCADLDNGTFGSVDGSVEVNVRNAAYYIAFGGIFACDLGFDSVDEFNGFLRSFVHLPVAGNNGFSDRNSHDIFSPCQFL